MCARFSQIRSLKKTTECQNTLFRRWLFADWNKNITKICKKMATKYVLRVGKDTIRRRLAASGLRLRPFVKKKSSPIRAQNRKLWLKLAKEHETWQSKILRMSFGATNSNSMMVNHGNASVMTSKDFYNNGAASRLYFVFMNPNVHKSIFIYRVLPDYCKKCLANMYLSRILIAKNL